MVILVNDNGEVYVTVQMDPNNSISQKIETYINRIPLVKPLANKDKSDYLTQAEITTQSDALNNYLSSNDSQNITIDGNHQLISIRERPRLTIPAETDESAVASQVVRSRRGSSNASITRKNEGLLSAQDQHNLKNAFMHSISIQANVQEDVSRAEELKGEEVVAHSGVTMSCLRNGCIDSVESAKIYLEVMLHNSIPHIINRTNTHVIIDNRLVYNTNLIWAAGGEKKLLNKHWGFINQAVTEHNLIPSNTPIKFIGLNLPPENYQDSRLNKSAINELYAIMVSKASAHNNNAIMMFLNILKDNKDKLNNYSGERGYHLGFVVEYLCSKLGIPYSEGCKSNKD